MGASTLVCHPAPRTSADTVDGDLRALNFAGKLESLLFLVYWAYFLSKD